MVALTQIDQAGASVGDTFNGRPIIAIQVDGTYVYGGISQTTTQLDLFVGSFVYSQSQNTSQSLFAMDGQTITGGVALYSGLAAKWPAWVSGADIVLPDWRGRAMMATGALGITGAAGDTYAGQNKDHKHIGGVPTVSAGSSGPDWAKFGTTQITGGTDPVVGNNQIRNDIYAYTSDEGGDEARPNAVGLVLCVIAAPPQVVTIDAQLPTSFSINTIGGNNNANSFTVNGVYRGNNTGSITGSTFGNWTWRIRVKRIGNYIEQHYWNDTANIGFRESHDGGSTWSAWGV